jgi:signal transduction histidine kinase
MKEAASRMDKLILDLLELGRLNTIELTTARVDLEPLIQRALVPLEGTLQARGARVEIKEPLLPVSGSPVILEQVLANLLGNGLKFVAPEATPNSKSGPNPMIRMCEFGSATMASE